MEKKSLQFNELNDIYDLMVIGRIPLFRTESKLFIRTL